jgi:hypothetical protein
MNRGDNPKVETERYHFKAASRDSVSSAYQAALESSVNPIRPVFNMTCTNVPRPQILFYFTGHSLERYLPMVPVGYESRLGCAIFTCNHALAFGMTTDARACSDVDRIKQFVDESCAEVRAAAGFESIKTHCQ